MVRRHATGRSDQAVGCGVTEARSTVVSDRRPPAWVVEWLWAAHGRQWRISCVTDRCVRSLDMWFNLHSGRTAKRLARGGTLLPHAWSHLLSRWSSPCDGSVDMTASQAAYPWQPAQNSEERNGQRVP